MREALKNAQKAYDFGEVPIGAVLICQGKIIGSAHNQVESLIDATAHAEMLCLQQGAKVLNRWRLAGCTLYTTVEPCPMCAGALISSRVDRVVWAAPDVRQGAGGSLIALLGEPHPIHTVEVASGILAEEAAELMKRFFQERRVWKKSLTH